VARGGRVGSKGIPRAVREEQILDAAAIEFARRGFAALSVVDVAARAGISKPLIYGYFGSKEGLYVACAERAGRELTGQIDRALALPDLPALEMGGEIMRAVFTALEPRPHDWTVLFDRSLPPGSAAEETARRHQVRMGEQATVGIAASFPAGVLPDPLDLSALTQVWVSMVSALVDWWHRHPDQSAEQMIARSGRLLAALGGG
jgi:AcrR family transcriptional regulator